MTDNTPTQPRYVRYRVGEEWSALYIDGLLDRVGDTYLSDERIAELLGVEERESPFLASNDITRDDVPKTVEGVEASDDAIRAKRERAATLREQAAALIAEAGALDPD